MRRVLQVSLADRTVRIGTALAVACAIVLSTLSSTAAFPASLRACDIVREQEASILYVCGDRLRSLSLRAGGMWERPGRDMHGRFYFECFGVPPFRGQDTTIYDLLAGKGSRQDPRPRCEGEPVLNGFFLDTSEWQKSARDEHAILSAFVDRPVFHGSDPRRIVPACPAFDVTTQGVDGRAACFTEPGMNGHAIMMIADEGGIGFLLVFYQDNVAPDILRDRFLTVMRQFRIERASGDISLLRWFRELPPR